MCDSDCSPRATVINNPDLVKSKWKHSGKSVTNTLGGNYESPFTCDAHFLGIVDFDPDLPFSVISWKLLEDLGCEVHSRDKESKSLKLPSGKVAKLLWVEGILVGSIQDIVSEHALGSKHLNSQWKGERAESPSDHLSKFKLVSSMKPAEIRRLDKVHRALQVLVSPLEVDLYKRVKSGELRDTDFDENDVKRYFDIFERELGALRGKTKSKQHEVTRLEEVVDPGTTGLSCDLFFICGIPFFISVEFSANHIVVSRLKDQSSATVISVIKDIQTYYHKNGVAISCIEFDRGGPSSVDLITQTGIKLLPKSTHASLAEVSIKLVKERVRSIVSLQSYSVPKKLIEHFVVSAAMAINASPRSVNQNYSPQYVITKKDQDYRSQFAFAPGEYCEVHTSSSSLVTQPRTIAAIALHPDPNNMTEWVFISLQTYEVFTRHHSEAYPLPMTTSVTDRINFLSTHDPAEKDDDAGVREPLINFEPRTYQPPARRRGRPRRSAGQGADEDTQGADVNLQGAEPRIALTSIFVAPEVYSSDVEDFETAHIATEYEDGDLVAVTENGCSRYCCVSEQQAKYSYNMSVADSIDEHGKEVTAQSVRKELDGLVKKQAFTVIPPSTDLRGKEVIPMSFFLTMKRDGTLKSRMVAGGHRQKFYEVSKTSSPTVSVQALFSVISIGVSEQRHFMTMDINQAYLRADLPDEVYMWISRDVSAELVKIQPQSEKMRAANGKLLVKIDKALYGLVQSGKLWYDKVSAWLRSRGFRENRADPCVFNRVKSAGENQITVALYVDDLLVTCRSQRMLEDFKREVESEYDLSSCNTGDKIEYLGISIDLSSGKYGELKMTSYIENILKEREISSVSRVPASENLFDVDDSCQRLSQDEAEFFHSTVASLLYLSLRVRPDTLVAVTFLCSRVDKSTREDAKKLNKLLSYLNYTKDMGCRIGVGGDSVGLHVYCDASFAVTPEAKSVGGVFVSLGRGPVLCKCGRQKLVSRSSTEAELISLSDGVSVALWTQQFLKEQGYEVVGQLYEDNQSTMKLAQVGRSTSDRTRHINIRYYFVKQYLENGALKIQYCPTLSMIADILTKPLQGKKFEYLRSLLLGYESATHS